MQEVMSEVITDGLRRAESRWRAVFLVVSFALVILVIFAGRNARRSLGRPFAGLLTDPYGAFSAVRWPEWQAESLPLRFPDQLVAINGEPVAGRAGSPVVRWISARFAELQRTGQTRTRLTFETGKGEVTIERGIRTLGINEIVFFFGLYALVALFVFWSGVAVMMLAWRQPAAKAYATWALGTVVFLVTFFDYHTTGQLVPLFTLSTVVIQVAIIWLAYSFPTPPRRHRRALHAAAVSFAALGVAAAVALLVGPRIGRDVTLIRVIVGNSAVGSLVVLLVAMVARLQRGPRERRDELRSAAWGLALVPGLLSIGFMFGVLTGSGTIHLFLPLLAPQVPLSIGYSLFRHNILETRAVLTRRILWIPIASTAGAGAILIWLACHLLLRQLDLRVYIPWASSLGAFAVLALLGYRFTNRLFFSVRGEFRPIIQRLSDDLTSNRDAGAIAQALEAAVLRWLPTRGARIVHTTDLHRIPECPPGHRERLSAGEAVWTTESPRKRHLLLPMRSRGELRAVLQLAPKHHAELYTQEDLAMLDIVASLGAVALHNAHVIAELETFRRVEVDAARDEKRFALGLLGAEITHEIAYPLNFLRYLLGQGSAGRTLDTRDVEIGQEEIGRLERMFSTLSKLRIPMPRMQPVLVLPRARRACDLIRETLISKEIDVVVDVPSDLTVVAEPDPLVQIFANLLRNAAQAVDRGRPIGIVARHDVNRIAIEVWDSGPGVPAELQNQIFNPFVTSKEGSMGLGLAVTERLVRSFGWSIGVGRQDGRTVFRVDVPGDSPRSLRHARPS
jgi:signal transduction histidine kinase